jgi:hypothetical protein
MYSLHHRARYVQVFVAVRGFGKSEGEERRGVQADLEQVVYACGTVRDGAAGQA